MKIFLYNNFHFGDILLNRSIILAVKRKYPEIEVLLGCENNKRYLWEDIGYQIQALEKSNLPHDTPAGQPSLSVFPLNSQPLYKQDINVPSGAIPHYLWFGAYWDILDQYGLTFKNQALSFNRTFEKYGLFLETEPSPKVFFKQTRNISIPENSILVDNGQTSSSQSRMPLESQTLERLVKTFPQYAFLCASKPNTSISNILDFSQYNLIELSQIGDKVKTIISRGTAVYVCTFTENNRTKPKFLCGWSLPFPWQRWDDDGVIFVNTEEALISAMRAMKF